MHATCNHFIKKIVKINILRVQANFDQFIIFFRSNVFFLSPSTEHKFNVTNACFLNSAQISAKTPQLIGTEKNHQIKLPTCCSGLDFISNCFSFWA